MKRYIFAQRAGVHIIDLDQTLTLLERALSFVRGVAEANREVLFVGTKKQAQIPLAEEAIRSGQPFVAERYIGGMLTNFQTILPRIQYFKDLAVRVEETPEEDRTGKDWFALNREYQKLRRNFAGITEMERLPGAVFVIDPKREELLVKEANRLKIPVVALTDTNCDPEVVDYVIPGNDDAIRSISLLARLVADAVVEGRGEEAIPAEGRPVPPVVEEARVSEEAGEEVAPEVSVGTADGLPEGSEGEEAPTEEAARVDEEQAQLPDASSPEARDGEAAEAEVEEAEEAVALTDEVPEPEAAIDAEASEPEAAAGPEAGEPEGVSLDEENETTEESEETEEK